MLVFFVFHSFGREGSVLDRFAYLQVLKFTTVGVFEKGGLPKGACFGCPGEPQLRLLFSLCPFKAFFWEPFFEKFLRNTPGASYNVLHGFLQ